MQMNISPKRINYIVDCALTYFLTGIRSRLLDIIHCFKNCSYLEEKKSLYPGCLAILDSGLTFHMRQCKLDCARKHVLKVAFTHTCQRSLYKTEKSRKSLGWNGNVEKKWTSEFGETTGENDQ